MPVPVPPVILLTVEQSDQNYLGCTAVLPKPFHIKDLLENLRRIVDKETASMCLTEA